MICCLPKIDEEAIFEINGKRHYAVAAFFNILVVSFMERGSNKLYVYDTQAALFGESLAISRLFFTRDESPNKAP